VRSVGYSDLFVLSKKDMWDVLKAYYPPCISSNFLLPVLLFISTDVLTLSYSSKIITVLYPQRVSLPLKTPRDMFSDGNTAHSVLVLQPTADSNGRLAPFFLNLNLLGQEWKPAADYNGRFARFKFFKK
jgi:hypothetical protein